MPGLTAAVLLTSTLAGYAQDTVDRPPATNGAQEQAAADRTPLVVSSCDRVDETQSPVTFYDEHHSLMYRATEKGMQLKNLGRFRVIGGLIPTTNIAAQAGSLDMIYTTMASQLPAQSPIGRSPFRQPRERNVWVPSFTAACGKP